MKRSWLYLNENTFIWCKGTKVLVYNSDNYKSVVYKDIDSEFFRLICDLIEIKNLYLVKGKQFFDRFQQMQGKEVNGKIQIPLPTNFFDQDIYEELLIAEEYSQY